MSERIVSIIALVTTMAALCAQALPKIDTSPDRNKTDINPGLKVSGTIKVRGTKEIDGSNWSVGCETVDRKYTDFNAYKSYLEPLGIKKIRFQTGWARCETEKGKYDFGWIDEVVDYCKPRGIVVWMELSYGNPIYVGGGDTYLKGKLPVSDEAYDGWKAWVAAMAKRYSDRVDEWEIWNEPDINRANTPELTADFNVMTAQILKTHNPDCKIAGLAMAGSSADWFEKFIKRIDKQGALDLFTWMTLHGYPPNPDELYGAFGTAKRILEKYTDKVHIRQGESGCPSERQSQLALRNIDWSELKQCKWNLRRMMGDLGRDFESMVFSIMDMIYAGSDASSINRKGLLRTDNNHQVEKIKMAYYAVQNTAAIFDNTLTRVKDAEITVDYKNRTSAYLYSKVKGGEQLLVVWDRSAPPLDCNTTMPTKISVKGCTITDPVWVDLISGRIYEFPKDRMTRDGDTTTFTDVPVYDAPVLLAERVIILREHSFFIRVPSFSVSFEDLFPCLQGNGALSSRRP